MTSRPLLTAPARHRLMPFNDLSARRGTPHKTRRRQPTQPARAAPNSRPPWDPKPKRKGKAHTPGRRGRAVLVAAAFLLAYKVRVAARRTNTAAVCVWGPCALGAGGRLPLVSRDGARQEPDNNPTITRQQPRQEPDNNPSISYQ